MKTTKLSSISLWPIALAGTLAVFAGLLLAARFVKVPKPATVALEVAPSVPAIDLSLQSGKADDRTGDLYDNVPLFFPTELNASNLALPADIRREPGMADNPFPWKPFFGENSAAVSFPDAVILPVNPPEGLTVGDPGNPFRGMGESDRVLQPMVERIGFLEVSDAGTGKLLLSSSLNLDVAPLALKADWHPLELLVAINPAGLVGMPTLVNGSGSTEVDTFFKHYFANGYRIGARFLPGFYTLRIGP